MAYLSGIIVPQRIGLPKPIPQQVWLIYEWSNGGQKSGGLWGSSKTRNPTPNYTSQETPK